MYDNDPVKSLSLSERKIYQDVKVIHGEKVLMNKTSLIEFSRDILQLQKGFGVKRVLLTKKVMKFVQIV